MADARETLHIDAPAELVYDLVSDLPRMGEWSPECERVVWRAGATFAEPGASFIGHNRAGTIRWITFGTVTAAERGRALAFDIYVGPVQVSRWEYFFVPDPDGQGCTVAEQWTDRRSALQRNLADRVVGNRFQRNRTGITQTLAALKRVAEAHHHHHGR
ncbi:MAG: SRPBCC family protein [Candidatus Phosphoribacter sp.]|nr:SRPBCC family protein [Actinomycetales bacterium]